MDIYIEELKGITVFIVSGRIDASNYKKLDTEFKTIYSTNNKIIMDLSLVEFMDSTGLGSIVSCLKISRQNNSPLKITGINNKVKVLFTITKADKIFDIYDNKESAVESFI